MRRGVRAPLRAIVPSRGLGQRAASGIAEACELGAQCGGRVAAASALLLKKSQAWGRPPSMTHRDWPDLLQSHFFVHLLMTFALISFLLFQEKR